MKKKLNYSVALGFVLLLSSISFYSCKNDLKEFPKSQETKFGIFKGEKVLLSNDLT